VEEDGEWERGRGRGEEGSKEVVREAPSEPRAGEEEEVGKAERSEAREEAGERGGSGQRRGGEVGAERGHEEVVLSGKGWEGEVRQ
jgi:hypothetical protein